MAVSLRKSPVGKIAPKTWTTDPEEHRRLLGEGLDGLQSRVTELETSSLTSVTVTGTTYDAGPESLILVDDDAAGGPVTINLPPAAVRKAPYYIKKLGTTGSITINPNGLETIDRVTALLIGTQYSSARLATDGANWWVT